MTAAVAPSPRPNLFDLHARERLGVGDDWSVYHFEARQDRDDLPKIYVLDGAVAPFKSRGKYRHHRDWKKLDPTTVKRAVITHAEHAAWVREWSLKTGLCPRCVGTGDLASTSSADGTKFAPCRDCGGAGKAKGGRS